MEGTNSPVKKTKFKSFVKHLLIVARKHQERDTAKRGLQNQIVKIKQASLASNPKRWIIEDEIKKLEIRLGEVLIKEIELLRIGKEESRAVKELKDKVGILEFQLNELRRQKDIRSYENNISELNNNVQQNFGKPYSFDAMAVNQQKQNFELRNKIQELEQRYHMIKTESSYSKEQLFQMETKISQLKERLMHN